MRGFHRSGRSRMNDDIRLLVDNYYRNSKVQFNPLPWHDYLCACWKTITQEIAVSALFTEDDLNIAFAPVDDLLKTPFKNFFNKENWSSRIDKILSFLRTLLASFQNQSDKIFDVLYNLQDLLKQTRDYLLIKNHSLDQFREQYQYSLLIPGGHCFVFDDNFKQSMLPNPNALRNSGHRVRLYEDVYCFEINAKTRPSSEVFLREFIRQISPDSNLFPSKTLAVLLTYTPTKQFIAQLLQLSLRVPGVTLETLIFAHDAFSVINPNQDNAEDIVRALRKIINNPPTDDQLTPGALIKMLDQHYNNPERCEVAIHTLLRQKMLPSELFMAMSFLTEVTRPKMRHFASQIKKIIPYLNGLSVFIREYTKFYSERHIRARDICAALANAYQTISANDIHLLAMICHIFLAHDAVGSNIMYVFNGPSTLCYIDPDECLVQSPIKLSVEFSVRHYPQINTILTNFAQFHSTPYHPDLVTLFTRTSPDELFMRCLFSARKFEKTTQAFISIFDLSSIENLEMPLIISEDVLHISFEICRRMFAAVCLGKTIPQAVLQYALPNTAQISELAYTVCKNKLATWETLFFRSGKCYEDLAKEYNTDENKIITLVTDSFEIARDESLHKVHAGLKKMCELMALSWIDYELIGDPDLKKVTNFAERHLLPDGSLTNADIESMREREPNQPERPVKSRSTSEDFRTPRSYTSTETASTSTSSSSTTPRNSKGIGEFFKNMLNSASTTEGKRRPSASLRNSGDQNDRRPKFNFLGQRSVSLNSLPIPQTQTEQEPSTPLPKAASATSVSRGAE